MAEFGAHMTNLVKGIDQPNIFTVLAQDGLLGAVRPALNHLCRWLAQQQPWHAAWVNTFSDEIHVVLDLALQGYMLQKHDCTFSEKFYGLKRTLPTGLPLNNSTRLRSIATSVILPYLHSKGEWLYENLTWKEYEGQLPEKVLIRKLATTYIAAYPFLHMLCEAISWSFHVAYLVGKSRTHSPMLPMTGVILINSQEDKLDFRTLPPVPSQLSGSAWVKAVSLYFMEQLMRFFSSAVTGALFFLQFMQWWYNRGDDHGRAGASSSWERPAAIPEPPQVLDCGAHFPDSYATKYELARAGGIGKCPLCSDVRKNDTLVSVSGFAFCFSCILPYVRKHQRCPVTQLPFKEEHLIRLYHQG